MLTPIYCAHFVTEKRLFALVYYEAEQIRSPGRHQRTTQRPAQ